MINACYHGDTRDGLRAMIAAGIKSQCCITSPPYWGLRDYGVAGQIGSEKTPAEFVETMVDVFRLVFEVLADDGVLWLNLGDNYSKSNQSNETNSVLQNNSVGSVFNNNVKKEYGLKPKNILGMPWHVAFALQASGWILRQDIIWSKPNPMPESVRDRCTKSHEYIFMLTKNPRYYYDADAIKEKSIRAGDIPGGGRQSSNALDARVSFIRPANSIKPIADTRNKRSVWTVGSQPYSEAHFAVFPEKLIEPMILASSRPGDIVLDPFLGSGTVAKVAQRFGRQWIGCELNPEYIKLQDDRTRETGFAFV